MSTAPGAAPGAVAPPVTFGPLALQVTETRPGVYEVHGTHLRLGTVRWRRGYSRWAAFDDDGKLISGRHRSFADAMGALLTRLSREMVHDMVSTYFSSPPRPA
jgi:hypothetical protein